MRDTIYLNGDVVTIDENLPTAEAVVVRKGKIVFVGKSVEAMEHKRFLTRIIDLKGKTMLPGFIDPHSHFLFTARVSTMVNLSPPPVGDVACIDDIIQKLKKKLQTAKMKPGEPLFAFGFDDSLFEDKRPLTRYDLDKVSLEIPVYAVHQSAHTGVANSIVLEKFNIDEATEDPVGGHIKRVAGTQIPNGILEETAHIELFQDFLPTPGPLDLLKMVKSGSQAYSKHGITTVQDGGMNDLVLKALTIINAMGLLKFDVIGYYFIKKPEDFKTLEKLSNLKRYKKRFKVGGAKVLLDGSPQAKTAWLSKPYHIPPEGEDMDYRGFGIIPDDDLVTKIYAGCIQRDLQVLTHTNGDQASEQLLDCYEAAAKLAGNKKELRPVMIHAQTVQEEQLDRMTKLNMIPSFFQCHTYFWGDWHINSVLGKERAGRISPVRSAINRDMCYTLHQDSPILPPNQIFTLWTAVNRKTRSGETIGEDQKISVLEAIKGITINGAYQYFEEDSKGSIEAGKRADLVILDQNPLKVKMDEIKEISVLETIKDGKTIYKAQIH